MDRPEWLAKLLEVPTTRAQAKQIIKRSEGMLALVKARKSGTVNIGCPHCRLEPTTDRDRSYFCYSCAYNAGNRPSVKFACLHMEFDGRKFDQVAGVISLTARQAVVKIKYATDSHLAEVERYLLAHITWAEAVVEECDKKDGLDALAGAGGD